MNPSPPTARIKILVPKTLTMKSEIEIERLKTVLQSPLSENTIMWDEIHAVESDPKFLLGNEDQSRVVNQGRNSRYDSALM